MTQIARKFANSVGCVHGVNRSLVAVYARGRQSRMLGGDVGKASVKGTKERFRLRAEEGGKEEDAMVPVFPWTDIVVLWLYLVNGDGVFSGPRGGRPSA